MTAEATTSLFITYQTPVVLQPVVLKLTLQRRTWEQRPCSHLVDAFLKAARPSILKAAAFSQGRAPRVERELAQVAAVDEHAAAVGVVEALNQLDHRALTAAARADKGDRRAGGDLQHVDAALWGRRQVGLQHLEDGLQIFDNGQKIGGGANQRVEDVVRPTTSVVGAAPSRPWTSAWSS